jgi:hypothetical protein
MVRLVWQSSSQSLLQCSLPSVCLGCYSSFGSPALSVCFTELSVIGLFRMLDILWQSSRSAARHSENNSCRGVTSTVRCTLSIIRQYLDNIWSKCNPVALCMLLKMLSFLWCGREYLEISSSFFLTSRKQGFVLASLLLSTLNTQTHWLISR